MDRTKWRGPPTAAVLATDAATASAFSSGTSSVSLDASRLHSAPVSSALAAAGGGGGGGGGGPCGRGSSGSLCGFLGGGWALAAQWCASLLLLLLAGRRGMVPLAGGLAGFAVGLTAMAFPASSVFAGSGGRDGGRRLRDGKAGGATGGDKGSKGRRLSRLRHAGARKSRQSGGGGGKSTSPNPAGHRKGAKGKGGGLDGGGSPGSPGDAGRAGPRGSNLPPLQLLVCGAPAVTVASR